MANEPIALAKNLDPDKLGFPYHMSEKVDGIAVRINAEGHLTRQNKVLESIPHIQAVIRKFVPNKDWYVIGELFVEYGMPFKEAGGIIRRKIPDSRIKLMVYDVFGVDRKDDFATRLGYITSMCNHLAQNGIDCIVPPRHGKIISTRAEGERHFNSIKRQAKELGYYPEGYVARLLTGTHSLFNPGKRSWGMQRFKDKPTADLRVVNVVEATANKHMTFLDEEFEKGDGLRAIGRIEVEYKDQIVGVGPGKMTHKERRHYYENPGEIIDKIVEVEYMRDPSYDAMREPTFQRVRHDKTEADVELV